MKFPLFYLFIYLLGANQKEQVPPLCVIIYCNDGFFLLSRVTQTDTYMTGCLWGLISKLIQKSEKKER